MSRPIPPLDLMFFATESTNSPKHVGALLLFDRPSRGGDAVRRIVRDYRAATPVAPFNYLPQMIGRGGPQWKIAQHIDMEHHVQHVALPAGTNYASFLRFVEDLHEPMMDRNRPLFRVWIIEGLPGGQFALYLKMHHAVVDGLSAMMRITGSMPDRASGDARAPFFALDIAQPRQQVPAGVVRQLVAFNRKALQQTAAVKDMSLGLVRKAFDRLLARDRGSMPFSAPHTVLNDPIRAPRSLATLTLPLEEMRAVGKAYGGTINDVAATVVDAGVHAYLRGLGRGARKRLVAMCPVSLRDADDKSATTKASAIFVPMPTADTDIDARMQQVMASIRAGRDELTSMGKDAAMIYALSALGSGEAAGITRIARLTGHLANYVLSNVPGSRTPLYLHGARLAGVFPVSALGAGIGLNVTLASHADSMGFGFIANGLSLPDLPELARHVEAAFGQLKRQAARHAAPAKPAARAKPAGRAKTRAAAPSRAAA